MVSVSRGSKYRLINCVKLIRMIKLNFLTSARFKKVSKLKRFCHIYPVLSIFVIQMWPEKARKLICFGSTKMDKLLGLGCGSTNFWATECTKKLSTISCKTTMTTAQNKNGANCASLYALVVQQSQYTLDSEKLEFLQKVHLNIRWRKRFHVKLLAFELAIFIMEH